MSKSKCSRCKKEIPYQLLSDFYSSERKRVEDMCGVCALELSNRDLGLRRLKFDGTVAESMRVQALAYYKKTNQ